MRFDEYAQLDATDLSALLAAKEITPVGLAHLANDAIARANPQLEAVIEVFQDLLEDPTRDGMDPSGSFHGVPILLKDLGSKVAGRRQAQGIAWLKDQVSTHTDPLVANFMAAGLAILGRSTSPELGLSFDTSSPGFGTTRNPWNLAHTPGGSSGGSAAAVAAGLVPMASASDGGGSIRFPAGWTGLIGLKSTRGLLPLPKGTNEASLYPASEGLLTRSVRDTALAYDQLWPKPRGWGYVATGDPDWRLTDELTGPPRRLRIALSTGHWGFPDAPVDATVATRIRETARVLEGLGHTVEEIDDEAICDFERLWQSYQSWGWTIPCSEALAELAAFTATEPTAPDSSPQLIHHLERAGTGTPAQIFEALGANQTVTRNWGEFWDRGFDLLLCPVSAIACPLAGRAYSTLNPDPFEIWFGRLMSAARYTVPGNETGLPSIAVPAGLDSGGLPVGAQLYAPWRREDQLIHVAAQLETASPEIFGARPVSFR